MGQILSRALLQQRSQTEAAALALHDVPGYRPMHARDGGEMAVMLDTLPMYVRYELTFDGADEIAEVTEVSISGHTIQAGDFAAGVRAQWGRDCMRARAAAGLA